MMRRLPAVCISGGHWKGGMTAAAAPMRRKGPESVQAEVNDIVIQGVAVRREARRFMDGTMDARR